MIRGKYSLVTGGLLLIVCLCGLVLASSRVVANNEIIDKVHIIVYTIIRAWVDIIRTCLHCIDNERETECVR